MLIVNVWIEKLFFEALYPSFFLYRVENDILNKVSSYVLNDPYKNHENSHFLISFRFENDLF